MCYVSNVERPTNIYRTSSIPEMLLTPSFFSENCSFLSSVVAVRCTTFFFLRADPYKTVKLALANDSESNYYLAACRQLTLPPMRTCSCSLASFSWFIIDSFILNIREQAQISTTILLVISRTLMKCQIKSWSNRSYLQRPNTSYMRQKVTQLYYTFPLL